MPRPKGLPKPHFHRATGQWRLNVPGGKQLYLGPDKEEADRRYRRWLAEQVLADPEPAAGLGPVIRPAPTQRPMTVSEALAAYWDVASRRYADEGQRGRVWQAVEAVCGLYGPEPVAQFGAPQLKAVRKGLLTRKALAAGFAAGGEPGGVRERDRGLSRNYVNSLVGCVQTAWTWLESEGLVPRGSAGHLRTVVSLREGEGGEETPPVVPVEASVVEATLKHLGPVVGAMVRVQLLTGMRPGEVCAMRRRDLSLSADEVLEPLPRLRVRAVTVGEGASAVVVWVYAPGQHKTRHRGKSRLVPIGPEAQALLLPLLEGKAPDDHVFQPREAAAIRAAGMRAARKTKVQPSQRDRRKRSPRKTPGDHYTPDSYRQAVQRGAVKAGVERWHPNQLRHSAATSANDAADWDTAQALLGHASPDQTATYALQALGKAARHVAQAG